MLDRARVPAAACYTAAVSLARPPFRMLVLESPLAHGDVVARLRGELDAPGVAGFVAAGIRPWIGTVTGEHVEMWRRIPYRNSFLPVVRARLVPREGGTRLLVTMSLAMLTRVVLGVWMLAASAATVGFVKTQEPVLIAAPILFVLVCVLAVVAFNHEADAAERYLRQRLDVR